LELVFLGAMMGWSVIRGFQPDIIGLEKFMDFGFIQSILQSRTFPPHDMWFQGGTINYYYFGHYLSAVMTMVSGMKPAVAYNLMIATLFGLSVSGGIAVGASVIGGIMEIMGDRIDSRKPARWLMVGGLLAAFMIAVRGNLHTAGYFVNKWIGANYSWLPDANKGYWYPDATRYIPFTIHEFPMYSFVVADLHAHVINLPIVLLFLGGLVAVVNRNREAGIRNQGLLDKVKRVIEARFGSPTTPSPSFGRRGERWWSNSAFDGFDVGVGEIVPDEVVEGFGGDGETVIF